MKANYQAKFRNLVGNHLWREKWNFSFALLSTLILALTDLVRPWTLKIIIDNILLAKPLPASLATINNFFLENKITAIILVASSVILISLIKGIFTYSQIFISSKIGFSLAHKLRAELFSHLQRLSLSFHKHSETGDLLTKVTADTNNLRDTFSEFVLTFVTELVTLVGMVVIMFLVNWKLGLIVLATFPILATISTYRFNAIRESARKQRKEEGKIASKLHEVLNSILIVQAFGRESFEEKRFESQSEKTLEESLKTARLEAISSRSVDLITAIGTFAVLILGSWQALTGEITPGGLLVFVSYMNSINNPIRTLAKLSAKISRAMVSAGRIREIFAIQPEIEDRPDAIDAHNLQGEITFYNVSFGYGNGKNILNDVSFHIPVGKKVALLGASGAGKTTIISLILRLYEATTGQVVIDRVNIKNYQRESLRRQIGIVLQETILFGATVKENIAYGKPDATDSEIVTAAMSANAHDFIMKLEKGYDTVLGERGGTLSGGQRQRLSIARAFVRNAPILILDEPMTGLDVESEIAVREAMNRLMEGKTCLLITHDLQNAAEADWILMLENGRIESQGTPQFLHTTNAKYRTMLQRKRKHEMALGV
jgi:ATP-binding cassette subfamily B protein/subfamily B ATP-binding cassette protein MsbA